MPNNTEYLIFRYSIIKERQMHMYSKELPQIKGRVISFAVQKNNGDREFKRYGVDYSFIGFHYVQPRSYTKFEKDRYLIGKFAKLKHTETGVRVPGDIVSKSQDDWVGSTTIIDTHTQHIFVQKNWRIGNTEQIEKALNAGVSKAILEEFNCKVFVKGQTKENIFWNIVNESPFIYNLKLRMVSPNILETNKKAREALQDLQDIFKQDEIDVTLKNESGKLEIPIHPVGDYIEYISEGEGSWKMTRKGSVGGKKTVSSLDNIKIIEIPESDAPEIDIEIPENEKDMKRVLGNLRERELSLIELFHLRRQEFHE